MMDKRPWINADIQKVLADIRALERKQGGGVGWGDDDMRRLEVLLLTAARIREQQRPLSSQVRAAEKMVSNVNPVNLGKALKGVTVAAPLPDEVRDNILGDSQSV